MKINRNIHRFFVFSFMLVFFAGIPGIAGAAEGGPAGKTENGKKTKAEKKQLPGFGKYRVIRIDSDGVFPRILRIKAGSTDIWFNATDKYASVVFSKGDTLNRSTRTPTLFYLAPDGTYVSAAFGSGGVASAAFVKLGTYYYFVTGLPIFDGGAFAQVVVE
ncbi:MAG: hypothetical protein HN400_01035 [Nitrospinaceae bacterium]|nr:hypothetical protein [Nitrospinaceae bacterium]